MVKFFLNLLVLLLLSFVELLAQTPYQSKQHNFTVTEIVSGLQFPWGMDFLPDGKILISERDKARLRIVKENKLNPIPISGLPNNIDSKGQGGLLDVAVHPQFKSNNLIYLSYSAKGKKGIGTEVLRGRLSGNKLEEVKTIFILEPKTRGSAHYGSRLVFAADGTLFITTGDRYSFLKEAQNPSNHLGSVIRINDDGTIPLNNPFVGKDRYKPEIFSYGHRNAQGLALRKTDNIMWMHEHGPRGGDEVNILNKPGANYGWPAITYGIDYSGAVISEKTHQEGMEQPVIYWTPSIAPSGMTFHHGNRFPEWRDDIFVGALAGKHIRRLELDGNKVVDQEVLLENHGRIRNIVEGPDGYLYFITDALNGKISRLEPS